jgi:hypothetical protein
MDRPTGLPNVLYSFADAAGVSMYRFEFRTMRDEMFADSVREVRHVIDLSRQSLANHPTQATEGPADVRNLFFDKQRLPEPIYTDSSHRCIASKRHFLQ